ncbi:MAG TPA: topoisomerase C-terminal repeat-containing protein, partial [Nevskiaceae bacterium]|nr:topoisomerase C-terminal repeat-containing protein [Nevskiaceae bacterium]
QRLDTITLPEALELFKLPRQLGNLPTGEEVVVNIGRFGPYARFGEQFVSLKKDDDPYTVELPRVIELIEAKRAALEAATIRLFGDTGIRIVKGRFGPYITDGKRRARIPKGHDPEGLSVFECEAYLTEAEAAKPARKKAGAKKAAASSSGKATPRKRASATTAKAPRKRAPAKKKS